jgi:hypothetical protein
MIVGRLIGWVALLAGFAVLVRDLLLLVDTGRWVPLGLGEAWNMVDPAGYERIAAGWPDAVQELWMFAALGLIGFALIVLCQRRGRRRR